MPLVLIFLAGCATGFPGGVHPADQEQTWSYQGSEVTYLPQDKSQAIGTALAGTVINAGWTRWGEDTRVTILDRYFSASGRECVRARIVGSGNSEAVNLCQYQEGQWGATRVLAENSTKVTP